jgi:hypothetical protein
MMMDAKQKFNTIESLMCLLERRPNSEKQMKKYEFQISTHFTTQAAATG